MDYKILQHLHMTFAFLFFLSYIFKCVLFLTNSNSYVGYRKKTLVIENIFATLFLVFGIWMIVQRGGMSGLPGFYHLKITLALLGIPVGIIGLKKNNKILVLVSMLMYAIVLAIGLLRLFGKI